MRDDGVSYGDYVEQLTYLLFLKMDQERREFLGEASPIPEAYQWERLRQSILKQAFSGRLVDPTPDDTEAAPTSAEPTGQMTMNL